LDILTDVTAPASTPAGKVLGTTAVGQWGPVDPPAGGHDEVYIGPTEPADPDITVWINPDEQAPVSSLDSLTDVAAPPSTPAGKVLGTTGTGQWGPIDPPATGMSQADADARYVNVGGDTMTGDLSILAGSFLRPGGWTIQEHLTNGDLYIVRPGVANALAFDHTTGLGVVRADPTADLGIATKRYVDGRGPVGGIWNGTRAVAGMAAGTLTPFDFTATSATWGGANHSQIFEALAGGVVKVKRAGQYRFSGSGSWTWSGDAASVPSLSPLVLTLAVNDTFRPYTWINTISAAVSRCFGGVQVDPGTRRMQLFALHLPTAIGGATPVNVGATINVEYLG
jgi:hypothetical protein